MTRIVGIDPGLKGGLVLLAPDRCAGRLMPLRPDGKEVDGAAVMAWLFVAEPDLVVIERLGARAVTDQGGKAIRSSGAEFRFATGYGILLGVLQACAYPHRRVSPQAWKRRVLAGSDWSKAAAIAHVQRTLPDLDLTPGRCRVPQDGLADAACLALYGRAHLERRRP